MGILPFLNDQAIALRKLMAIYELFSKHRKHRPVPKFAIELLKLDDFEARELQAELIRLKG